ncbi:MAG TPA: phosphoribosyltransferase [Myxococcota bacterium]|nr:phosphoribosyltransferase [Myxococcota bacterium]
MFEDRSDAGKRLARRLERLRSENVVVLALPRGGVPVAFEVATALRAPLDLLLVRKIGAPQNPELAIGAIVDGDEPQIVCNEDILSAVGASEAQVQLQAKRELAEIERRRALYLRGRAPVAVSGKTAIVVDDGIATGATMRAALQGLRLRAPARVVLAVPVASPEALALVQREADEVVCLWSPPHLGAVGAAYRSFRQVGDDEVIALLERAQRLLSDSRRAEAESDGPAA